MGWLEADNAALRARIERLEADNARLRAELDRRDATIDRLRRQVSELQTRLQAVRRASKRQAAPHSRNRPKPDPGRPGRRAGEGYGPKAHRRPPDPEQVDEVVEVALPATCPHCGDHRVEPTGVARQWQQELPVAVRTIEFLIQIGCCAGCGRRVQPRHPRQTSDALGAAACQLGPRAVALAALLNKQGGLPVTKIATLYAQLGLAVTAGGICQAIARAARRCQPTYQALCQGVRASPVVAADETGWRVDGHKAWLWTFVGDGVIAYRICKGRGFDQAVAVLGEDFDGVLERDGWAPYRKFDQATHQTCLAHLLRRCRGLIDDAYAGQAKTPHAVRRILLEALRLRDDRNTGRIDADVLAARVAALGARIDTLIGGATCYPPNRRLLNHLAVERDALFTFLTLDGVAATNHRAERAIRPAVVNRKTWGGNRTWNGAATQQILDSVLTTAHHQQADPIRLLTRLLTAPARDPTIAQLAIPGR